MTFRNSMAAAGAALTLTLGAMTLAQPAMAQDEETTVIGVSIPAATHGWAGGMNYHAKQAVDRLGEQYEQLEFVMATASDPSKQVNDIEDMVAARGIDALVVLPFESEPLTGPVQRVAESGAWVTVVDRGLAQDGIEDLYVAGDNPGFGRTAGEYFAENLEPGSKIVVLRGIPTTIDNERVEAFQAAIEGSEIEILGMEHGNWNRDDAFTVMQDFLSRFDEIDAVWAADDDMAMGALAAIDQADRSEEMWVVGGAAMKEMVQRIMEGDTQVPVDVTYPPAMAATAIEMTALRYVANVPVSGQYIIGSVLVTPENAEDFYYPDSPY